jgi:hypothetical protein
MHDLLLAAVTAFYIGVSFFVTIRSTMEKNGRTTGVKNSKDKVEISDKC